MFVCDMGLSAVLNLPRVINAQISHARNTLLNFFIPSIHFEMPHRYKCKIFNFTVIKEITVQVELPIMWIS